MAKKILAFCAALVAFAVTPAMASAAPALYEGETLLATGSKVVATNSGNVVFTGSLGTVTCSKSTMSGTLVTNSTKSGIEGTISSASFTNNEGGACESWAGEVTVTPENLHWCVVSTVAEAFSIRGGGCGETRKHLRFTLHFPSFSCTFQEVTVGGVATGVTGTYKTGESPVKLSSAAKNFALVAGSAFLCGGEGTLDAATYTLATENGTGLQVK